MLAWATGETRRVCRLRGQQPGRALASSHSTQLSESFFEQDSQADSASGECDVDRERIDGHRLGLVGLHGSCSRTHGQSFIR